MKFTVLKDNDRSWEWGTSLMGYLTASYDKLVFAFGEPTNTTPSGDDKVTCEWQIRFKDGTCATIYDWKEYGRSYKKVTDWHIGGMNQRAVNYVKDVYEDAMRNYVPPPPTPVRARAQFDYDSVASNLLMKLDRLALAELLKHVPQKYLKKYL